MTDTVFDTISRYNMHTKDNILLAVSGGADSMTLLELYCAEKERHGMKLYAAHVNHCLRGEESDRDEAFVRAECEKRGVECFVLRVDVAVIAETMGIGIEECARNVRYDFFECKAKELDAITATAHTLNDNAETVLFHIIRGTGLKGLNGIPPVRGNIIRPLINVSREEILEYLNGRNVGYVNDSSNFDNHFTRNKIRNSLIPLIEGINPSFNEAVSRLTESVSADENYLDEVAGEWLKANACKVDCLNGVDESIRARVIRKKLSEYGIDADFSSVRRVIEMIKNGFGKLNIQKGKYVVIERGVLTVQNEQIITEPAEMKITAGQAVEIFEKKVSLKRIDANKIAELRNVNKNLLNHVLNCDIVGDNLAVRNRKESDKIRLKGRNVTKTLKKLFSEAGIPVSERQRILVISDENGVLWVEGFGSDERAAVKDGSDGYEIEVTGF